MNIDDNIIKDNQIVVRAFDGSRRETLGEIELPVEIGPYFQCLFPSFKLQYKVQSTAYKTLDSHGGSGPLHSTPITVIHYQWGNSDSDD